MGAEWLVLGAEADLRGTPLGNRDCGACRPVLLRHVRVCDLEEGDQMIALGLHLGNKGGVMREAQTGDHSGRVLSTYCVSNHSGRVLSSYCVSERGRRIEHLLCLITVGVLSTYYVSDHSGWVLSSYCVSDRGGRIEHLLCV